MYIIFSAPVANKFILSLNSYSNSETQITY